MRAVNQVLWLKQKKKKSQEQTPHKAGHEGHSSKAGDREMNIYRYYCLLLFSAAQEDELQAFEGVLGILCAKVTASQQQKLEEIQSSRPLCTEELIKSVL